MKAVVMGLSRQTSIREVDDAKVDNEHVLIHVKKTAICGSDKHTWADGSCPNAIIGHEYSGEVLDPGPRTDLKVGDHVTSITQNPCMQCASCKEGHTSFCDANAFFPGGGQIPGTFAEKFAARADLVYKMDGSLSFEAGALTEPVSVCYHALNKSGLKPGGK
ncbi:MAG: alcohol dehydrogenase catalytic domain-containing protein, partial [Evtepia sp.]